MLWAYVIPILNIYFLFFGKVWEYYNLQLKGWTLLLMSSAWYIMHVIATKTHHRVGSTNFFSGFPAKWLIFSAIIFLRQYGKEHILLLT